MPSGVNVPLTFQIYKVDAKGDQFVRTETLTQDIIKVGKLSSSHLRIDDEAVSRMHAVIEIAGPGEIYIIDLGSTKGTLVNGQKVNKTKLQSGDAIVLGNTKLVVTVGEAQAAPLDDGPTQVQPASPNARATVMGMSASTFASMRPATSSPAAPAPSSVANATPPRGLGSTPAASASSSSVPNTTPPRGLSNLAPPSSVLNTTPSRGVGSIPASSPPTARNATISPTAPPARPSAPPPEPAPVAAAPVSPAPSETAMPSEATRPAARPPAAPVYTSAPPAAPPSAPTAAYTPPPPAASAPTAAYTPPPAAAAPTASYAPPPTATYTPPPAAVSSGHIPPPFASPPPGRAPAGYGTPGYDPSAVELQDGSRAIEVAAMFEDAVIEVAHLSNPAGGRVTGATKGLLAGGAAALVVAFITFLVAFVQVSALKRAWDAWDAAGKPHNEFIVPREGPFLDIFVSVCLIFGVYALLHGLYRLLSERQPRDFTIGPDGGTLFNAPGELLPAGTFPLVRSTGTEYELLFTQQMGGDVTIDGQAQPLQTLISSGRAHGVSDLSGTFAWPIANGARAKVDLGQNTFLVSSVPTPRHYPAPIQIDWSEQVYTVVTAAVIGLFLIMMYAIPPDPKSLSLDAFMNDQRFAKFLIKPPEEKEEQIPEWLKKKGPDEAGGKGKRHKGEEGKMGKKTSKNKAGLYGLKGPPDNPDPHLAKMLAEEQAQKAGVLGLLKSQEGSHLASIFGRDSALGTDAQNALGGLVGTQIGEAFGQGGLGLVGSGKGGGGTGEGTIGLGNLGTIGKGGGGGTGAGYGRGAGGLSGHRAHAPDVVPGTAQVRGALSKEIIRRIIRRHLNEVKFCYEKELLHKPDLYGRVMVQFTISGMGQVLASMVQNSTMNNPEVEKCISDAVRRWEFPKPEGGGIVIVSYPFVLKAAGAE